MKNNFLVLFVFFSFISSSQTFFKNENVSKGVIRVKLTPQAAQQIESSPFSLKSEKGRMQTPFSSLNSVGRKFRASKMERIFPYNKNKDSAHKRHGLNLWYDISFNEKEDITKALKQFSEIEIISYAQPVYVTKLADYKIVEDIFSNSSDKLDYSVKESYPFDDSLLYRQWHYKNDGSIEKSLPGADINLFEAWKIETGNPRVVVCITDGGIDVMHDDLKDNIWINEEELYGTEGVDDDGNGYIDDIHGFNFVDRKGVIVPHTHGTHVAGTVGAVNNNHIGVSGVAGGNGVNKGVKLMSAQIFQSFNGVDLGTGLLPSAIVYGADNGAVISQNSWGYQENITEMPQDIKAAIDYFISEAGHFNGSPLVGGLVVFSAGNEYTEYNAQPQSYEKVIAVSSFAPNFQKAYYSTYGTWVDIAAPGGDLKFNYNKGQVQSTFPSKNGIAQYGYLQGTSMAAPHVSGIAALVISNNIDKGGLTLDELKIRLNADLKDINKYNPIYRGKLGKGYIDAAACLQTPVPNPPKPVDDLSVEASYEDFAILNWSLTSSNDGVLAKSYRIYRSKEPIDRNTDLKKLSYSFYNVEEGYSLGDKITYKQQDLERLNTYYFTVLGADRWGSLSDISSVVSAFTNENNPPVIEKLYNTPINLIETDTLKICFSIKDPEGHSFETLIFVDDQKTDRLLELSFEPEKNYYCINIKTDYESEGVHSFRIIVEDKYGMSSNLAESFFIERKNRAPVKLNKIEKVVFNSVNKTRRISLNNHFYEPDREEMSYDVELINGSNNLCEISIDYYSNLTIKSLSQGAATYKITASDSEGEKVSQLFGVSIFNDASKTVIVYPSPSRSVVNAQVLDNMPGNYVISIFDTSGNFIYSEKRFLNTSEAIVLDVSTFPVGIYLLNIRDSSYSYTGKIYIQ